MTYTTEDFFENARRWLAWVESMLESSKKMYDLACQKPEGLSHESNLTLDSEGGVWEQNWNRHVFVRLTRATPFGAYTRTDQTIPDEPGRAYNGGEAEFSGVRFVAKGWDQPEADWCWAPARYGVTTRDYYAQSLRNIEAGIRFGRALLAITPEALTEWADRRAEGAYLSDTGRDMKHISSDYDSFMGEFRLPRVDMPDNGSILCGLHLLVDRTAGVYHTSYAH